MADASNLASGRGRKHPSAAEGRRGPEGLPSRPVEGIEKECERQDPLRGLQLLLTHSWSSTRLHGVGQGVEPRKPDVTCDAR